MYLSRFSEIPFRGRAYSLSCTCNPLISPYGLQNLLMVHHRLTFSTSSSRVSSTSKRPQPSDIRVRSRWTQPRQSVFVRQLRAIEKQYFGKLVKKEEQHKPTEAFATSSDKSLQSPATANLENGVEIWAQGVSHSVELHKNKMHKKMWNCLKTRKWGAWEKAFDNFKASQLPPDEVSYTLLLHGVLISKTHNKLEAKNILEEMKEAKLHPSLVRINETLLNFYYEIEEYDVLLNDIAWRKVLRSVWLIAALVKGRRERFIGRLNRFLEANGRPELAQISIHDLGALWYNGSDPLLSPAVQDLISEYQSGENSAIQNSVQNMSITSVKPLYNRKKSILSSDHRFRKLTSNSIGKANG